MTIPLFKKCVTQGRSLLMGVLVMALGGFGGATFAQDEIYSAKVLVKTQAEAERNRAASTTLPEVAVRASGRSDAATNAVIKAAQGRAENYLFGFSYSDYVATLSEGEASVPAMQLTLNYSPEAIAKLLREAQLPLWPKPRPKLLIWVALQDVDALKVQAPEALVAALKESAAKRGLPVVVAAQDIEDQLSLTPTDLWRVNERQIDIASLRYKADAVLLLRLTPKSLGVIAEPATADELAEGLVSDAVASSLASSAASSDADQSVSSAAEHVELPPEPWVAQWRLLTHPERLHETLSAATDAELASLVINNVTDVLAQRYALAAGETGEAAYYLQINGINDFRSFKQAQDYLQKLAVFKRVDTVKTDAQSLLVKVQTEGDLALVLSTLALGDRLSAMSDVNALLQASSSAPAALAPLTQTEEDLARALEAEFEAGLSGEPQAAQTSSVAPALGTESAPLVYQWIR